MSLQPIIQLKEGDFHNKDTILRKKSAAVAEFDSNLRNVVTNLLDTLNHHSIAVGLSAPQIGVLARVTVINVKKKENKLPLVLVNPELLKAGTESAIRMEACMSLPFFQGEVERSLKVTVGYQELTGAKHQLHAEGFLARVLLHELDHLDGILYVDRMPLGGKLVAAEFFKSDQAAKQ